MKAFEHIVVGVDGSDAGAEAAEVAGRLALDLDAKVTAVHVRQIMALWSPFAPSIDPEAYWEGVERQASKRTAEVLDRLGAPWRLEVRTGDAATQLELAAAEHDAGLIVVGARGHKGAYRLLLGSVSTRLVHHAGRPVLVVR
ncbi:MAG TPA: universal stress protein [Chloroflexota bacterium]|jgi:nucleotide-binding universal stress UspA family protein|nr:universal stress protein [Chloroflexota bacterium]